MLIERDLRDVTLAPQTEAVHQRDALWHLLESCESFGGPTVRALARKRFEVFDGADVAEQIEHDGFTLVETSFVVEW